MAQGSQGCGDRGPGQRTDKRAVNQEDSYPDQRTRSRFFDPAVGGTEVPSAKRGLEVWLAFCPPSSASIEALHAAHLVPHLHEAGLTCFRVTTDELATSSHCLEP